MFFGKIVNRSVFREAQVWRDPCSGNIYIGQSGKISPYAKDANTGHWGAFVTLMHWQKLKSVWCVGWWYLCGWNWNIQAEWRGAKGRLMKDNADEMERVSAKLFKSDEVGGHRRLQRSNSIPQKLLLL